MSIVDYIFPTVCFGCRRRGEYLCSLCLQKTRVAYLDCPYCHRASKDGSTHEDCSTPFGLDGLVSLWKYEKGLRKAIISLKYKFSYEVARELALKTSREILKRGIVYPKSTVLIPVPAYWLRKNWRGYNQAELMGENVAKNLGWEFDSGIVFKESLTKTQTGLSGKERTVNIKSSFCVSPEYQEIPSSCLVFDDVWTTGSTIKEIARMLKRAGARKVWALTIARGI